MEETKNVVTNENFDWNAYENDLGVYDHPKEEIAEAYDKTLSNVNVGEVEENEYFHDTRIVVSVFMSIWNVHVNWFPVSGTVDYFRHHHGMFMVAWHPKSSEDNERTTTVIDMGGQKILFRQIAGLVARRIVSYARVGGRAEQNTQCGFIKFGSRVDLFLPTDADVQVRLGDKVVGTQTLIARLKKKE